ncbi:MAG: gamma-glutamyltransferase [Candidatus Zixiibacteriota bacterium]
MKRFIPLFACILLLSGFFFSSCDYIQTEKLYRQGIVVCADPIAAGIGLETLENGGNAVDAACATAFALAATLPSAGNIGGGGLALVYIADSQKVFYLDFRETAPAASDAKRYLAEDNQVDRHKATVGPLSAGTPGTVAGLAELHKTFGVFDWAELVKPARLLADTGFMVLPHLAESIAEHQDDLNSYASTSAIFLPNGAPPQAGTKFIQKDLGQTLSLIEAGGKDGFYAGETAEKIAAFCLQNGGLITAEDLAAYKTVWREPVSFTFRDLDIYASGLPSSGGIVMGQMLSILDQFELERYTAQSPEFIHLFTEAARRAYVDREQYLGDPEFTHNFTKELLDKDYIATRIQTIDPNKAGSSEEILPGVPKRKESDQTTHFVIVDRDGNIVSLTYTINLSYGSKAVVDGCGFLLNNEMDDFAIAPGQPNAFGLVGGEANTIQPGKRMLSSMTPTIIMRKGRPYMALGSPGGSKIITSVAQTIIKRRIFDLPLAEAVNSPRVHHQWQPDILYIEQGTLDINIMQELIARGHNVKERTPFGEVMAVGFSDDGKFVSGVADHRCPGGTVEGF